MPMEQKVQADTVGPGDGPVGFAGGDSMSLGVGGASKYLLLLISGV
jgi:hypothetical protein